ncbi:MAG: IPT/TIG domain-containing protein [Thermoanaerobaculia bacterium]|nr:IPT/TIG domain-containing protein [Thermoanaerobaculia bacterium]
MRRLALGLILLFISRGALSATPTAVDLGKLPAAAFDSLPDNALVEFDGRRMTKAQFLAEMGALRRRMTAFKPPGSRNQAPPDFSATRMKLLDKEKLRLSQKRAKVGSHFPHVLNSGLAPTPDSCSKPKITDISAAPPLEPGDEITLNGCGFGLKDPASDLRFLGDFPGGFQKLQIVQWHGNAIRAVVPPLSGVKDQFSKLQVIRKDLQFSNEIPAEFHAARDVTKLTLADLKQTCSAGHYHDDCAANASHTLRGLHQTDTAYRSGIDTVTGNLKNGCVLVGFAWEWWGNAGGVLKADPMTTIVLDSASISVSFPFVLLSPKGLVDYKMDFWALGPVGVPCH